MSVKILNEYVDNFFNRPVNEVKQDKVDVSELMAFEEGELEPDKVIDLFSKLIANGMAWQLQGFYGRSAMTYIKKGYLDKKGNILMYPSEE